MHALLLIRIQIQSQNLRSCHAVAIAFWRRWKIQMAAPYTPVRCLPLSKLELELGLVLGNASAKQSQVKNVFSFFCVFSFFESAWKLQAAAAAVVAATDAAQWLKNC